MDTGRPLHNDNGVARTDSPAGNSVTRDTGALHQLLIESVTDYAIFALDAHGNVASWNPGAERLKGYALEEIVGKPMTVFYPAEKVAEGFPASELAAATRDGRFEDEGWRVRKDGTQFWANVVITALRDAGGNVVGFAKVTRDLTARREKEEHQRKLAAEEAALAEANRRNDELASLNARLQEALAAAAEAYRDLDQFAYVASHDLKAPLRGIANLAQWIQDDLGDRLAKESVEHMRLLQGRVRRMEALIDGILTYSRAGRQLTEPEQIESGTLVREIIELLAPEGVTITVAADMPTFLGERVPLQQVFINLVGNAIKFTRAARHDGTLDIGWRDANEFYEFAVRDNGPGIAPEFRDRIWGIFQTLNARDKVEGTGIGLSVVKKIVETRGGHAWVESTVGGGATFKFTWPKRLHDNSSE